MKRVALAVLIATLLTPVIAAAETWTNVPLVDKMCLGKVKSDPDKHEAKCLISCAHSGYGVLTSDGTWVKLDKKGNEEALKALKATTKTEGIRVTVTGERKGDTIAVSSLTLD